MQTNVAQFQQTGILLEKGKNGRYDVGVIISANNDQPSLPRSFATNGSRALLLLHVALHAVAISFLVVGCEESRKILKLDTARVLGISTIVSYSFGFLSMLFVAAWAEFPTDKILLNTLSVLGYLVGIVGTTVLFALSIRATWEKDHYWLSAALFCELAAVSLMIACIVNLTARGGRSHTAPGSLSLNAGRAEALEIAPA